MTHEEAKAAVLASTIDRFGISYGEAIEGADVDAIIYRFLEMREAALCSCAPVAWLLETMLDGKCVASQITFIPSIAETSKAHGYRVTALHAALQDSPPILRVEGETQ